MPRGVCFMNAASYSPLPLLTQQAGHAAVGRCRTHGPKHRAWTLYKRDQVRIRLACQASVQILATATKNVYQAQPTSTWN
jgi:hypothetical protein